MASPASAKKQLVDNIKDETNILVTVNRDPSVDELAAALALTIFLNKLGKHATAVVSGEIPSAMDFLAPDDTFEATTDSLRDFIIALDKEKADHLRYKLEGDMVKIFITPYRTTISNKDLEFSQGDYNVELVIALNVENGDDFDKALAAHGKILHSATVTTITARGVQSDLGSISWHDDAVSGVSEMVAGLLKDLKTMKVSLDDQMSTALLTGIVAATDRFSNDATSPTVMTVAAELMAAGANQQLIATKLEEAEQAGEREKAETPEEAEAADFDDGSRMLEQDQLSEKLASHDAPEEADTEPVLIDAVDVTIPQADDADAEIEKKGTDDATENGPDEVAALLDGLSIEPDGTMRIEHPTTDDRLHDATERVMNESRTKARIEAEEQLDELIKTPALTDIALPPLTSERDDLFDMPVPPSVASTPLLPPMPPQPSDVKASVPIEAEKPSIGGTLNATTAVAEEQKRLDDQRDQNRTILTHSAPLGSMPSPENSPQYGTADTSMNASMSPYAPEPEVTDVFELPPNGPVPESQPDFSQLPPLPPMPPVDFPEVPLQAATPPLPSDDVNAFPPVMPANDNAVPAPFGSDLSGLPPVPPLPPTNDPLAVPPMPPAASTQPVSPTAPTFNPGQFQIPPQ